MSCQNVSLFCCFWKPRFLLMEDFHIWPLHSYTYITFSLLWCNRKAQANKKKTKPAREAGPEQPQPMASSVLLWLSTSGTRSGDQWRLQSLGGAFATWEEVEGIWSLELPKSSFRVCMWALQSQGNVRSSGFSCRASPCFCCGRAAVGLKVLHRIPCAWAKF